MRRNSQFTVLQVPPILKQLNPDHNHNDRPDNRTKIIVLNNPHRKKSRPNPSQHPRQQPQYMTPLSMPAIIRNRKNIRKDQHRQKNPGRTLPLEQIRHQPNCNNTNTRKPGLGNPNQQPAQSKHTPLEITKLKPAKLKHLPIPKKKPLTPHTLPSTLPNINPRRKTPPPKEIFAK